MPVRGIKVGSVPLSDGDPRNLLEIPGTREEAAWTTRALRVNQREISSMELDKRGEGRRKSRFYRVGKVDISAMSCLKRF